MSVVAAELLRDGGYDAETVQDEGISGIKDYALFDLVQAEKRILITLDLDFSDIRIYPPHVYGGIIVLRPKSEDFDVLLALVHRVILALRNTSPENALWIVDQKRIRIRN
jgi:predicted nuclease of predicted toxin-antitoxin system